MWISSASILPVTVKSFCSVTFPAKFEVPSISRLPVAIILPLELIFTLAVMCVSTNKLPPTCNDADGFCIPCTPTSPEADICNPGLLVGV